MAVRAFGRSPGGAARILAIDRFDGVVGTREFPEHHGPNFARFQQTLARGGIAGIVDIAFSTAAIAHSPQEVALALIDGLHDHASVAQDFASCASRLAPDARVAFHDYAAYFPDVCRFVDELVAAGDFHVVARAETLVVLERCDPR